LLQGKAGRFDTASLVYPIGSILVEFSDQLPFGLVEESKDLFLDLGLATERAKASLSAVVFQFRPLQTIPFPQSHSIEIPQAVSLTHRENLLRRLVLGTHDGLVTNKPNRQQSPAVLPGSTGGPFSEATNHKTTYVCSGLPTK
jgi:hypothetical protein